MPSILDLVSTPVAVLNGTALQTSIGLSGDDPLTTRNRQEVFRVFLSVFSSAGALIERREVDEVGPGERRFLDLSALTGPLVGDRNTLAVVHRVPTSLCPRGQSPDRPVAAGTNLRAFHMYRGMVQYRLAGRGHGSVIYESPLRINDTRDGGTPSRSLMFSSKVLLSEQTETYICFMNYSTDPSYATQVRMTGDLLDAAGTKVCDLSAVIGAFQVDIVKPRDALVRQGAMPARLTNYSVVMHSGDGTTIPLLIQVSPESGSVSVEHTHAPQSYLQPSFGDAISEIRRDAFKSWTEISR